MGYNIIPKTKLHQLVCQADKTSKRLNKDRVTMWDRWLLYQGCRKSWAILLKLHKFSYTEILQWLNVELHFFTLTQRGILAGEVHLKSKYAVCGLWCKMSLTSLEKISFLSIFCLCMRFLLCFFVDIKHFFDFFFSFKAFQVWKFHIVLHLWCYEGSK